MILPFLSEMTSTLSRLPYELHCEIFQYLSLRDFQSLRVEDTLTVSFQQRPANHQSSVEKYIPEGILEDFLRLKGCEQAQTMFFKKLMDLTVPKIK